MALGVMTLDVRKFGRLSKGRYVPIELSHPPVQRRVAAAYIAQIALFASRVSIMLVDH